MFRESNRPLPEGMLPLSPMEETIMNIIGESMEGVMIVNDPLAEAVCMMRNVMECIKKNINISQQGIYSLLISVFK